jgi:TFIIF-interacting CTD phosphatase-like protein
MKKKQLYKPFKSKAKNKKMSVYVIKNAKKTLINFGDSRYRHNYSNKARKAYLSRSAGIKDKSGNLTKNNKNSANYWSRKVLWKA